LQSDRQITNLLLPAVIENDCAYRASVMVEIQ
jgi:hypothetical protein